MSRWLLFALTLASCGPSATQPRVVLYSSIDDSYTRLVCREFEQSSGIRVDLVTDSEAAKSTGLVQRLIAEKTHPVADVFWSGDSMRAMRLQQAGVADGGTSGAVRLRLIVFNTKLAQASEVPQSIEDLAKPLYAKRACMANPLYGSSSMHAAALLHGLGKARAQAFYESFSTNGGRMVASNGEVKRRVANGEFAWGITDSDDVAVALGEGKAVGFVVPDQAADQAGVVLVPAASLLVRGAPHLVEGRRLAEYLSSAEPQRLLAGSEAEFFPTAEGVQKPMGQLKIELKALKQAPALPPEIAAQFEAWEGEFLEAWCARQLQ